MELSSIALSELGNLAACPIWEGDGGRNKNEVAKRLSPGKMGLMLVGGRSWTCLYICLLSSSQTGWQEALLCTAPGSGLGNGHCAVPVWDVSPTALTDFSKPTSLISRWGVSLNPLKNVNGCRLYPAAKPCVSPGGYTSVLQSSNWLVARRWVVVKMPVLNYSLHSRGN